MPKRLIIPLCLFCWGPAAAAEIGFASSVDRSATGELGVERRSLDRGSKVRSQEILATDAVGRLSLQFSDRTLLTMGPLSRVKLERFVMKADGTAREVALRATQGAFRFATGISASRVYRIETPAGVMGVRGTRFTFEVRGARLQVSVTAGAVQVCPTRAAPSACRIARPGNDVIVANRRASIAPAASGLARLAPPLLSPLVGIPRDIPRMEALPRANLPQLGQSPSLPPTNSPAFGPPSRALQPAPGLPSLPGGGLLGR